MAFTELEIKLMADISDLRRKLDSSGKQVGGWVQKNKAAINSLSHAFLGIGVALTGAVAVSAKAFATFSQGIANVMTLVRDVDGAIREDFTEGVKELAGEFGVATDELTASLFDIQSATGDAANAMSVLEAATKLSVAGNSSLVDSTSGLLTLMESYKDELGGAADAADLLFKAQEKARATVGELAVASGKFLPIAKQLGVDVNEVFAAFSQTTVALGNSAEAATALGGVFTGFLKPTEELKEFLKKIGEETRGVAFESSQAAIESIGFLGVLEKLAEVDKVRIPQLFANKRALVALGPLLQSLNKVQADNLDIQNRQGAVVRALEIQMEELSRQWKVAIQNAKLMAVEVGQALMPEMKKLLNDGLIPALKGFRDWVKENPETIKSVSSLILKIAPLALALGGLMKAVVLASDAVVAMGGILNAVKFAGLLAAIAFAVNRLLALRQAIINASVAELQLEESFGRLGDSLRNQAKRFEDAIRDRTNLTEQQKKALAISRKELILAGQLEEAKAKGDIENVRRLENIIGSTEAVKERAKILRDEIELIQTEIEVKEEAIDTAETRIAKIKEEEEALNDAISAFTNLAIAFDQGTIKEDEFRSGLRGMIEELAKSVGGVEKATELIKKFVDEDFDVDILINPPSQGAIDDVKETIKRLREDIELLEADADTRSEIREKHRLERQLRRLEALVNAEKIKAALTIGIAQDEFDLIQKNAEDIAKKSGETTDKVIEDARREREEVIKEQTKKVEEIEKLVTTAIELEEAKSNKVIELASKETEAKDKSTEATKEQTKAAKEAAEQANKAIVAMGGIITVGSMQEAFDMDVALGQRIRVKSPLGSAQGGMKYVPTTGNFKLHRGEQVIPAGNNPFAVGGAGGGGAESGGGLTIINLFDKDAIPEIMAENPNATLNIVNKDILSGGTTRRLIRTVT